MKLSRNLISFRKFRRPAGDYGGFGEKRIQDELSDKRLRLMYNIITKNFEVWYVPDRSQPYLVIVMGRQCDPAKVIYPLRRRQLRAKQMASIAKDKFERGEKDWNSKNAELARETTEGIDAHYKGKVSVTV